MSELTLPPIDQLPETKCIASVLYTHEETNCESVIQRFSSLSKMQRVLAYCFRFVCRRDSPKISGSITQMEYDHALNAAVLCTQLTHLSGLRRQIKNQGSITPTTTAQLAPFIDAIGIIRVGGRLRRLHG